VQRSLGACIVALALGPFLAAALAEAPPQRGPATADVVSRGCPPERALDGEVRLVFLGDSGYGAGFSEWGTHGQDAIATQLRRLRLAPDLVFFLGDNVYWLGSAALYKARFDDMYEEFIGECKAHVTLGNHDVKGCRAVEEFERWEACVQDLRDAMVADRKARYVRQGMDEAAATRKAEAETAAETTGELAKEAIAAHRANCLPGDASAYEDVGNKTCNAAAALEHAQFGFGSVERGDPPASRRQRYYSILWPLPRLKPAGGAKEPQATPTRPMVDVIVLDSNTLEVDKGVLVGSAGSPRREDRLQLLWLRNAMAQWLPAPGEPHRIWKIVAMHHAPFTPKACACRIFGKCVGGHGDEPGLQRQLRGALEGLEPPDLVMTAHNHIYARSRPLDAQGNVAGEGSRGVRYFISGGGGAPLYAVAAKDERFVKALGVYHFIYWRLTASAAFFWTLDSNGRVRDSGCFEKGSNVDHPLSAAFRYYDALPPRCAPGAM
jgi:hypothetical protein